MNICDKHLRWKHVTNICDEQSGMNRQMESPHALHYIEYFQFSQSYWNLPGITKSLPWPSRVTFPNCLVLSVWKLCHVPSSRRVLDTRIFTWPVPMFICRYRWPLNNSKPKKWPFWNNKGMDLKLDSAKYSSFRLC